MILSLLFACVPVVAGPIDATLSGTVRDTSTAVVAKAQVTLLTPDRTIVAAEQTDPQGRFTMRRVVPGVYLLIVRARGFDERRLPVVATAEGSRLEIVLEVGGLREDVTVTASRDSVTAAWLTAQSVNVIEAEEIGERVKTVVAQAVEEQTGVHVQRTSPTMGGVFVRGLTGNKVNIFVDGVRYSNGAQRGGVNAFLDLIEPTALDSIEVLRGPSSAEYGSDALGGSVQFLTAAPSLGVPGGPRVGATLSAAAGTAHRNGGGSALVSLMRPSLGVALNLAGRRVGLLRAGEGIDSHAAVTRFFGLPSTRLMGERLPDTGFDQLGGFARANWTPSANTQVAASYMRSSQDDGKRYDQLLGGDGNLIADLNGLSLDLLSVRFEQLVAGPFQHASLTYSLNRQREERVNQGGSGNPAATIGHEPELTAAHGVQGSASRQLSARQSVTLGGDVYFERIESASFNVDPVTGSITPRRPRIPSGATFRQGGVYAQTAFDASGERLRLIGSVRLGGASYTARAADSPVVNLRPLWPDDSVSVSSVTFRAGAVATPSSDWTVSANVSRGFRAPHMTDLGTLGLTGSGFEVSAPDVAGLGGTVGTTADASASSTGRAVAQVQPETSLSYEATVRYRQTWWQAEATVFVNNIYDNIQKQALILPLGAVGRTIAGQPITSQSAGGAVFVSVSTVPVLVRANFDNARIWGVEHTARMRLGSNALVRTTFTYMRAQDTATGLPPNIEGGTPAPDIWISLHLGKPGRRWWVEPYVHGAWEQTHLSSLDVGDRRIGASRSRNNIRAFFLNGARARGWIGPGPDGVMGTSDDVLSVTGETLAQIQDRVLGPGVDASPLFPTIPGYTVFGVRTGLRHARHELLIDLENLGDKNYRGLSWGVDAPGRGISLRYVAKF